MSEAYEVLSDKEKRDQYDNYGSSQQYQRSYEDPRSSSQSGRQMRWEYQVNCDLIFTLPKNQVFLLPPFRKKADNVFSH